MRTVSPALSALLRAQRSFWVADCLTITLKRVAYSFNYTNSDVHVLLPENNRVYYANEVGMTRDRVSHVEGLESNDMKVTLTPHTTRATLFGSAPNTPVPLLQMVATGAWLNAEVELRQAFMAGPPEHIEDAGVSDFSAIEVGGDAVFVANPTGSIQRFIGDVTSWKLEGITILLTVTSILGRLTASLPRHHFKPGCCWELYSSGCGVSRDQYKQNYEIAAGSTKNKLRIAQATTTLADEYLNEGLLVFETGTNLGVARGIKEQKGDVLTLREPLLFTPRPGDKIWTAPGCDKTIRTCIDRYNNKQNFRGFPRMPGPDALRGVPAGQQNNTGAPNIYTGTRE